MEPMQRPRLFAELPAGLASVSLRLHGGAHCRPPISRMGNKAGYAAVILAALGRRSGTGADRYLWAESDPDVAALLRCYPDAAMLRRVAEIIRGWKDEEPRELWERLRAERKGRNGADGVARYVQLAGANRLIPGAFAVDGRWVNAARDGGSHTDGGVSFGGPEFATDANANACTRLAEYAATVVERFEGMARDVATTGLLGQWSYRRGEPDSGFNAGLLMDREPTDTGGNGAKARTCEQEAGLWTPAANAPGWPIVAVLPRIPEAADIAEWLGTPGDLDGVIVYMDPDYVGTTGYRDTFPRADVVRTALAFDALGALVCVSEAVAVAELVALGWHASEITAGRKGQRRTFARVATEALTMNRAPMHRVATQPGLFAIG